MSAVVEETSRKANISVHHRARRRTQCLLVERVRRNRHLRPSAHVAIIGRHTLPLILEIPEARLRRRALFASRRAIAGLRATDTHLDRRCSAKVGSMRRCVTDALPPTAPAA